MIFSSTVFLFQFLPVCLIVYFGVLWATRRVAFANIALIVLSLAFYFIGNGYLVILLAGSIVLNFVLGRLIARSSGVRQRTYLTAGIIANLALLMYYKYANFLYANVAAVGGLFGWHPAAQTLAIALPVGISFYTFMSISYLVQVRADRNDAKSPADYATYLSLFPHLVAGPIVRFSELRDAIAQRRVDTNIFMEGIFRFSVGLARKVIIADSLAIQADRIFALPVSDLTPLIAWVGAICYAFQIFYDFSGYTDMAIGLANMLGFRFPENFNQPYTAATVTDFWRRWHMTLTRWFRDYVYIPLGGNRRGSVRTYVNLFVVFFLCGLWHGAAWMFVVWGMYHGILLVLERLLRNRFGFQARGFLGVVVTFLLVTFGWVFFRSTSIIDAFHYIGTMVGVHGAAPLTAYYLSDFLPASTIFYLVVAALFAFAPSGIGERFGAGLKVTLAKGTFATVALLLSIAYVSETTFRPFIYFRF